MNNKTLAKYDGCQKKCRNSVNKKLEVPAKYPQRICRNALSSHQIGYKMKGEHRKIPDTNISPLSIFKPPSFLHANSNKNIMTTHHIVSQIPPNYDPMTNTSPSPRPLNIHTPCPIQPSKHSKSKPILQNKIGIKIDSQLIGKHPQTKDFLLILLPNPQESPPNKIGEHTLLTAFRSNSVQQIT